MSHLCLGVPSGLLSSGMPTIADLPPACHMTGPTSLIL
jgi:hypothetical protein